MFIVYVVQTGLRILKIISFTIFNILEVDAVFQIKYPWLATYFDNSCLLASQIQNSL